VATVRWRNCHHSSVYGQSVSRKMVNKWMPNSIYSQKESKIFFLTKRNHFFFLLGNLISRSWLIALFFQV
jgi:hypothetical protein